MLLEEAGDTRFDLQPRNIDIEVHPVDAFDFKSDMLFEDGVERMLYNHSWLRSSRYLYYEEKEHSMFQLCRGFRLSHC